MYPSGHDHLPDWDRMPTLHVKLSTACTLIHVTEELTVAEDLKRGTLDWKIADTLAAPFLGVSYLPGPGP